MTEENGKKEKIPIITIILGLLIIVAGVVSVFWATYRSGLFIFIVIGFALIALAMNYKNDGTERNAWDVWFFGMPGVIVTLFLVGVLGEANDPEIWRWIAIALGGAAGLESLSSIVKDIRKS